MGQFILLQNFIINIPSKIAMKVLPTNLRKIIILTYTFNQVLYSHKIYSGQIKITKMLCNIYTINIKY